MLLEHASNQENNHLIPESYDAHEKQKGLGGLFYQINLLFLSVFWSGACKESNFPTFSWKHLHTGVRTGGTTAGRSPWGRVKKGVRVSAHQIRSVKPLCRCMEREELLSTDRMHSRYRSCSCWLSLRKKKTNTPTQTKKAITEATCGKHLEKY